MDSFRCLPCGSTSHWFDEDGCKNKGKPMIVNYNRPASMAPIQAPTVTKLIEEGVIVKPLQHAVTQHAVTLERPNQKKYASNADRQKAYRQRKR